MVVWAFLKVFILYLENIHFMLCCQGQQMEIQVHLISRETLKVIDTF